MTNQHFETNVQFINTSAAGPSSSGNLLASFNIVGLGDNVTTTVIAAADATAVYACMNRDGSFPLNPKTAEVSGTIETSGEFTSGGNGQITRMLTLSPPAATLECPGGQIMVLVSVFYTNIEIFEPDAGQQSILGTFERTFFEI
ncbi:hypothetical protein ACFQZ1_00975 [Bacillus sp. CGMCC 1.60114]|uniref:hypothetical protein n=1 Tax=unclassified Bacillus (in: firmicutes) TaxID=185979 RepID=UPI0036419033